MFLFNYFTKNLKNPIFCNLISLKKNIKNILKSGGFNNNNIFNTYSSCFMQNDLNKQKKKI